MSRLVPSSGPARDIASSGTDAPCRATTCEDCEPTARPRRPSPRHGRAQHWVAAAQHRAIIRLAQLLECLHLASQQVHPHVQSTAMQEASAPTRLGGTSAPIVNSDFNG